MTRIVPLLFLALSACAAPMDQAFPTRSMVMERDGRTFHVRTQFDPFGLAWSTRVWSPGPALTAADEVAVMSLVSFDVGPQVCDGAWLEIGDGEIWNSLAGSKREFNAGTGEWRLIGTCA